VKYSEDAGLQRNKLLSIAPLPFSNIVDMYGLLGPNKAPFILWMLICHLLYHIRFTQWLMHARAHLGTLVTKGIRGCHFYRHHENETHSCSSLEQSAQVRCNSVNCLLKQQVWWNTYQGHKVCSFIWGALHVQIQQKQREGSIMSDKSKNQIKGLSWHMTGQVKHWEWSG
jgi:hypothetical protein